VTIEITRLRLGILRSCHRVFSVNDTKLLHVGSEEGKRVWCGSVATMLILSWWSPISPTTAMPFSLEQRLKAFLQFQ
jgi:hypothetical protein